MEGAANETAGNLQNQQSYHRGKIDAADGRDELAERAYNRLDDLIQSSKRLLIPADIGKPAQQAPDDDQHGQHLENA